MGDKFDNYFNGNKFEFLSWKTIMTPAFLDYTKVLVLMKNLPKDGSYTEQDVVKILIPFGFIYEDENIYVSTQLGMAFFVMPSSQCVRSLVVANRKTPIKFHNSKLLFQGTKVMFPSTPFEFYQMMMGRLNKKMTYKMHDDGTRMIYIKNIDASKTKEFRETLNEMACVRNFLPFLNKVFVEFLTVPDADRLGVWYSLLRPVPTYRIYRLTIPHGFTKFQRWCSMKVVAGVTIPSTTNCLSNSMPLWVTILNRPFVFPTALAWFGVPNCVTIRTKDDITRATLGPRCSTIMLTGLPEGHYRHEDVARLVWSYFPKQDFQSLYYDVSVLMLQRRAFVHFKDWPTCRRFAQDHISKPLCLMGFNLQINLLSQHTVFGSTEMMYTCLMKLSNSTVSDPDSLEERLLIVEISEASVNVVTVILNVVSSIAAFVGFLPLANRICVEMADASGVAEVVDKYSSFPLVSEIRRGSPYMEKVVRVESLKSLKQRLKDAGDLTVTLDPEPSGTEGDSPMKEDVQEPGAETVVVATATTGRDGKGGVASPNTSKENTAESPQMDQDETNSKEEEVFERFRMEDFVTVDEVDNDPQDPDPVLRRSSSSKCSSRDERQRSYKSPDSRRTSSRSTRTSKNSWSHEDSLRRSSSSRSSRPPTSPSSSDRWPKSPAKAGTTLSPTCRNKDQASTAESSPPESQGAVPHSDHRVSAGDTAERTVELEMHPPAPGPGLSQNQSLETDNTVQDQDQEKDDLQKNTEEEENYEVLDSFDEQNEDDVCEGPDPESLQDQTFQVLDSIEDEGEPISEHRGENEVDMMYSVPEDLVPEVLVQKDPGSAAEQLVDGVNDQKLASEDLKKMKEEEEVQGDVTSVESKDAEEPDHQVPEDEDQSGLEDQGDVKEWDTKLETFEILDSTEDQTVVKDQGAKPGGPTEQESEVGDEEDAYEVVDSVEDQPTSTEMESEVDNKEKRTSQGKTRPSRRSGRRTRGTMDEDQESSRKPETTSPENQETTEVPEMYEDIDSEEEEPVPDAFTSERSSARGKKRDLLEEATYQVLDSVEEETGTKEPRSVCTRSTRGRSLDKPKKEDTLTRRRRTRAREGPKKEEKEAKETTPTKRSNITVREEEEATYEVVDSVEEEPPTRRRGRPRKHVTTTKPGTGLKEEVKEEEEVSYQVLDSVEDETTEDLLPAEHSKSTRGTETSKEEENLNEGGVGGRRNEEEEPVYQIVDSVEDDQVQDTAREEEQWRRQAAATAEEEVLAKRRVSERDQRRSSRERERRSNSRGVGRRRVEVEVDVKELVTLDEVGADGEETAGDLQELVTLDEVRGDEEEKEEVEEHGSEEDQMALLQTVDEVGVEKDEEEHLRSKAVKRKHSDSVDSSGNFVTVGEVGGAVEEEEAEPKQEAPKTRGGARKKTRRTAVRRSTRGKKVVKEEEEEEPVPGPGPDPGPGPGPVHTSSSSSSDKDLSTLSPHLNEVQKTRTGAPSAGLDLHSDNISLGGRGGGGEEEEEAKPGRRGDMRAVTKRRSELVGPESKRSRPQSPCVSDDDKLPPFHPDGSYGREFVVPTLGFFCKLCRVFYVNDNDNKDVHCSSRTHYDNLQDHLLGLKSSRCSTGNGSVSD